MFHMCIASKMYNKKPTLGGASTINLVDSSNVDCANWFENANLLRRFFRFPEAAAEASGDGVKCENSMPRDVKI